ncbi:hypothetical protein [Halobellus marinus]|nr:hypothetical protein [Halobellus sp. DFY28]
MNYDISPDESVSQAVVSSVSKFEDTAFTDLPSLYEHPSLAKRETA